MQTVSRYYSNAFTGEITRVRIALFLLSSNDTCPAKSLFLWDKTKLLSDLMKDAICVKRKMCILEAGFVGRKKAVMSILILITQDEFFDILSSSPLYFYRKLFWGAANKDINFDFWG